MRRVICIALSLALLLAPPAFAADGMLKYTVQKGDTMSSIAAKFDVSLADLVAVNPHIGNPDWLYAAMILNIPTYSSPGTPAVTGGADSLTYLYAGTTVSYLKLLDKTGGAIKTVCPDYFDINPDGSLLITPSNKIDKAFVDEMHARGIVVTPFISNHWDKTLGNAALNNRTALSTQVADMIVKHNLDGINIDIENVNEQYRAAYTDFARQLRNKLPANKLVTVAVAANPKGWKIGWHGSYDYKALADTSDYLMIMSYDESYYGGPEGPVASAQFFEDSIKYALNQDVPADKIVAGLPFFGRYWREGAPVGGNGITANDIEYLLANYSCTQSYDLKAQSASAVVTIKPTDPNPKLWGGSTLAAGVYRIWYDNLQSTMHKLSTVNRYGIRGAGSWALGQENVQTWDFYTTVLNGTYTPPEEVGPQVPPPTVPVSATLERILDILNNGDNPRTVTPVSSLTRAEAAAVLSEWVYLDDEPSGNTFADTQNHWAAEQIGALRNRGVVRGFNHLFKPDEVVSREELCAMIQRITVLPNTIDFNELTFADVPPSRWSYSVVGEFFYFGIVNGYSNDRFGPTDGMRVEHLALILDRIAANSYPLNPNRLLENGWTEPILEPR